VGQQNEVGEVLWHNHAGSVHLIVVLKSTSSSLAAHMHQDDLISTLGCHISIESSVNALNDCDDATIHLDDTGFI